MKTENIKNLLKISGMQASIFIDGHYFSDVLACLNQELINISLMPSFEREIEKRTILLIILEILYQIAKNCHFMVDSILEIRRDEWREHCGVPTIEFLLSYDKFFEKLDGITSSTILAIAQSLKGDETAVDLTNNIVFKKNIGLIKTPSPEKEGYFIKTLNQQGYMTTDLDPFSMEFVQFCKEKSVKLNVLEIGAAFGVASLSVLKDAPNTVVYCNDLDTHQLRAAQCSAIDAGVNENLVLLPGSFPDELNIKEGTFDAILICRVLHFFTGEQLDHALQSMKNWLVPGGKVFIVVETPFLKNWASFESTFLKRKKEGLEYPGQIDNPSEFEQNRSTACPPFIHFMDDDGIKHALTKAGFDIERVEFIDRAGQFPQDLLKDGKESVGATASKSAI